MLVVAMHNAPKCGHTSMARRPCVQDCRAYSISDKSPTVHRARHVTVDNMTVTMRATNIPYRPTFLNFLGWHPDFHNSEGAQRQAPFSFTGALPVGCTFTVPLFQSFRGAGATFHVHIELLPRTLSYDIVCWLNVSVVWMLSPGW